MSRNREQDLLKELLHFHQIIKITTPCMTQENLPEGVSLVEPSLIFIIKLIKNYLIKFA